jgi:hypothetical protein
MIKKIKFLSIAFAIITIFQSCQKNADSLYNEIKSASNFELKENPDGTDETTKSVIIETKYNGDNLDKVDKVKNTIDSYLGILPTVSKKGEFDGNLKDYYEWESSEFKVWMRVRYNQDKEIITIIIFYTKK